MERLPHTKTRDYKEVEKSFNEWVNWDKESKIKRLQQFGLIENWHLDETLFRWLEEAEECYIMGFFKASSFFAGATLEVAMKAHALTWKPPERLDNISLYKIINKFQEKKIITQKEKDIALEIKNIRNYYGHGLIDDLARKAFENGMKVKKRNVVLTKTGTEQIPGTREEIITKAENSDMKLTFAQFNAEQLAWKTLRNVHILLLKLFPRKK